MIRRPTVAGQFYPFNSSNLKRQLESFVDKQAEKQKAIAAILPHAGYIYSGRVAGVTISQVALKDTTVILGTNHTGRGESFSLMSEGSWQTPLGQIEIDIELAKTILKNSRYIKEDALAHSGEHSIEVEIPFLQYLKQDIKIVPIVISPAEIDTYRHLGEELSRSIKESKKDALIIASSDMTHYEPQAQAERKDKEAIKAIEKLDMPGFIEKIRRLNISMCGYAPVAVLMEAARNLGASRARLILYQTSGDITGDYEAVVGYAGMIVS